MPSPVSYTDDTPVRLAAFQRLEELTRLHGPVLPWSVIMQGFTFNGETLLFANRGRGIFSPRQMHSKVLSIKTPKPRRNRTARYSDRVEDPEEGVFIYDFQDKDPQNWDNRMLREACLHHIPLIYFVGITPSRYQPIWPVFIDSFDIQTRKCRVVADDLAWIGTSGPSLHDAKADLVRRSYVTVQAKKRVHQAMFRVNVLSAYRTQCAVCLLPHESLLHAAHIRPDSDELSEPTVQNGLALCLLHHGAFDANLMGIRPDGHVELSPKLIGKQNLPIAQCAFQAFEGTRILRPARQEHWPSPQFIEERYRRFRQQAA